VLIPHIVRMQEVTPLNRRSLDIGNGNTVELRRNSVKTPPPVQQQPAQQPAPQPAPVQPTPQQFVPPAQQNPPQQFVPPPQTVPQNANPPQGATAMNTPSPAPTGTDGVQPPPVASPPVTNPVAGLQLPQGGQSTQDGVAPPAASSPSPPAPAASGKASVRLDPPVITQALGTTAAVNVMLDSASPVHDFSMELKYDPAAMQLLNVTNGGYLSSDNQPATVVRRAENGVVHAAVIRAPSAPGVPGQGAVLTLVFLLNKTGDYVLTPASVAPKSSTGLIPVNVTGQTAVKILNPPPPL